MRHTIKLENKTYGKLIVYVYIGLTWVQLMKLWVQSSEIYNTIYLSQILN